MINFYSYLYYVCIFRCDLTDCFKSLKSRGINSVLVEGGAHIIQSILESDLADQVVVTVRPCFLGG